MKAGPWVKWYAGDFLNGVADLAPPQIAVYAIVLNRIYDEGQAIPNDHERIGRRCNMRPSQCRKVIDGLLELGKLVLRDGLLSNERCEIELGLRTLSSRVATQNANARWKNQSELFNENNEDAMRAQCETDANQTPDTRSQILEVESKKDISPKTADFDGFYAAYPRKVGKDAARRAYNAAIKRADHATIMAGLATYTAAKAGTEAQYIAHPSTWLNQGRWDDEPEPPPRNGGGKPNAGFGHIFDAIRTNRSRE